MAFLYGWKATGQADDLAWTPADYPMRIALSQIGPLRIELIEAKKGESSYADFMKEHGCTSMETRDSLLVLGNDRWCTRTKFFVSHCNFRMRMDSSHQWAKRLWQHPQEGDLLKALINKDGSIPSHITD